MKSGNGECDAEHRTMLGCRDGARRGGGRELCLCRADQRRLLPAGLPLAAAAAQERRLLRNAGGGRGSRVSPVQALPARRSLAGRAACRGDRPGLRADPRPRHAAEPRRAGRRRPASAAFISTASSSRSPARRRANGARRTASAASPSFSMAARASPQSVYAAGFGASSRAYEAAPNGLGMTPARAAPRRQGRDDPLYDRADPARPRDRRRDRARHLHDRARRRSGDARSRAAPALPGGGACRRRTRR